MTIFETLPQIQRSLMNHHLDLVIEANKTLNLTRIDTSEEGFLLHIEDSLQGLEELQSAPDGPYADMGSGAGYPGIPLAIASGRQTVLIDARQKKMHAVQGMIEELGLQDQIATYAGRAELYARDHRDEFTAITARALAKLPVLMELASPLLKKNGLLICYKANMEEEELAQAKNIQQLTGLTLQTDRSLNLQDHQRRILTFKKTATPTIKLPRQENQAQKHPLTQ